MTKTKAILWIFAGHLAVAGVIGIIILASYLGVADAMVTGLLGGIIPVFWAVLIHALYTALRGQS